MTNYFPIINDKKFCTSFESPIIQDRKSGRNNLNQWSKVLFILRLPNKSKNGSDRPSEKL